MVSYRNHIKNNISIKIKKKTYKSNDYRFSYKVKFRKPKGKTKELIVICMNPSKADKKESDVTVNMLIEHAYESNYKGMILLNAFPLYEPNSTKLPNKTDYENENGYKKMMAKNKRYISYTLNKHIKNDILIAFGRPGSRIYMKESMKKIIDLVVSSIEKNKNKSVFKISGGYKYYHHPKNLNKSSRSNDKKKFLLDILNTQMLLNSKNSL